MGLIAVPGMSLAVIGVIVGVVVTGACALRSAELPWINNAAPVTPPTRSCEYRSCAKRTRVGWSDATGSLMDGCEWSRSWLDRGEFQLEAS